jgi:hypothetical protein
MQEISQQDVQTLLATQARIHVKFDGLQRIDPVVLQRRIASITSSQTVGQALGASEAALQEWKEAGFFRDGSSFHLEPFSESSQDVNSKDVLLCFDVEEARAQKSGGVFATESAVPEVRLALKNVFGGRYSAQLNYIPPASRLHSWTLSVQSRVPWIGTSAEYSVGAATEKKLLHPADVERIEEVKAVTFTEDSKVTLGFQQRAMAARDQTRMPSSILSDFPKHTKGYLKYEVTMHRAAYRQHPVLYQMYPLPVGGFDAYMMSEVCGGLLGGSACFHKWECQLTRYWSLGHFLSMQSGLRVGTVSPFFPNAPVPLNDRFFLSQRHVRGYKSVGPSTFDDGVKAADGGLSTRFAPTGGTAVIAGTTSLNFPLPFYPSNGMVAMHLFADGGALRMIRKFSEMIDWRQWWDASRFSVGGGLVLTRVPFVGAIPDGRFELNWSLPVRVEQWAPFKLAFSPSNRETRLFESLKFGLTWSSAVAL